MDRFSPKIEIINHFDNLIHRVGIEIEKSLEKCTEDQLLSQCKRLVRYTSTFLNSFNSSENDDKIYATVELWSESTKVVDYLNQVRMRTIEELRKEQNGALEYYKSNQKQLKDETKIEDLKSKLFGEKFYFQVLYKPQDHESWFFNLFTICVDFYMSPDEIDLLEKMINSTNAEIEMFFQKSNCILDEKMVLIDLIYNKFYECIKTEKYPNQMIGVRKEDILDIQRIECSYAFSGVNLTSITIDLSELKFLNIYKISNIEEIKLENLSSLQYLTLQFKSIERVQITLRNLLSLREFELILDQPKAVINSEILDKFLEILPNIECLRLSGDFSYFNLDNLVRLNTLYLHGTIQREEFNFDIFKNLCSQLTSLEIYLYNIDDKSIEKLFYGLQFPNLSELNINNSFKITKLEKKLFDGFSNLKSLKIYSNNLLRKIDHDVFSDLKQLRDLDLCCNRIESLDKGHFSELINLESLKLFRNQLKTIENNVFANLNNLTKLELSDNQIEKLNPESFAGLRNLKELTLDSNELRDFDLRILDNMNKIEEINLAGNLINNEDEILSRFKDSKIKFVFYYDVFII